MVHGILGIRAPPKSRRTEGPAAERAWGSEGQSAWASARAERMGRRQREKMRPRSQWPLRLLPSPVRCHAIGVGRSLRRLRHRAIRHRPRGIGDADAAPFGIGRGHRRRGCRAIRHRPRGIGDADAAPFGIGRGHRRRGCRASLRGAGPSPPAMPHRSGTTRGGGAGEARGEAKATWPDATGCRNLRWHRGHCDPLPAVRSGVADQVMCTARPIVSMVWSA